MILTKVTSGSSSDRPAKCGYTTLHQGLTLFHFSAQRRRLLWDRVCIQGVFRWCLGGFMGYQGVFWVFFVPETARLS